MKLGYPATLMVQERREVEALVKTDKISAKRFLYARSLLFCDAGPHGSASTVSDASEAAGVIPQMNI